MACILRRVKTYNGSNIMKIFRSAVCEITLKVNNIFIFRILIKLNFFYRLFIAKEFKIYGHPLSKLRYFHIPTAIFK